MSDLRKELKVSSPFERMYGEFVPDTTEVDLGYEWCEPHLRWEWDCFCGQGNARDEASCGNCCQPKRLVPPKVRS